MNALAAAQALRVAEGCVAAAGLSSRVEVTVDPDGKTLLVSGPDHFGFLGTMAYRSVRVSLPTSARMIAIATARHLFAEYWASDEEIAERATELPLALAVALQKSELPRAEHSDSEPWAIH